MQASIKELEQILKSTNRVIAAQKDVRADTERGKEFDSLEKAEQRVRDSARNLAEEIDQKDARRSTPGEEGSGEEPSSDKENSPNEGESAPMPGEKQPGEKQPGDNQKGDPESPMPGDTSPMDPSQPGDSSQGQQSQGQQSQGQQSQGQQSQGQQSEGQQSEGQQSEGQPSPGQQSQSPESEPQGKPPQPQGGDSQGERTPGRQELEEAQRAMEKAIEELKQQQRDNASNEQDQAIAQLEAMKAKIEEILRQLREEERELHLTMLEARFQEMLKLIARINADTLRLDAKAAAERGEAHFTKSRDLSRQEQQNVLSAEKALALLKEEGSSVAFPEAVEQMQSNMAAVAVRLTKGDTGETTQLLEKLIVESLEEMVLSLQKELEQIKQDQQQQQPGQQGGQQNRRLVEQLAELKMIRSLQNQVNRLTKQVGLQIEGEQAEDADTVHLLRDLARRQQRIQDATYDLSIGRNQ